MTGRSSQSLRDLTQAWPVARDALRVLVVDDDSDDRFILRDFLAEIDQSGFAVTEVGTYEDATLAIRGGEFDVHLIDYRLGSRTGMDLIRDELGGGLRGAAVLLTGAGDDAIDREASEGGASGYLVKGEFDAKDLDRAIRFAVRTYRTRAELLAKARPQKPSKTISFLGVKGGVGCTTLVANAAVALSSTLDQRVVAAELRPYQGTLAQHFGLVPARDVSHLANLAPEAIGDAFEACLATDNSSARVLASPQSFEGFGEISVEAAGAIADAAAAVSDVVLFDLPPNTSDANREIAGRSDLIAVVADREPPSLAATEHTLRLLQIWGVRDAAGLVIVDRWPLPTRNSAAVIADACEVELLAHVQAGREQARAALESGSPVVRSSPHHFTAQAMNRFAELIDGLSVRTAAASTFE